MEILVALDSTVKRERLFELHVDLFKIRESSMKNLNGETNATITDVMAILKPIILWKIQPVPIRLSIL